MIKRNQVILTLSITIVLLVIITLITIVINSPYYKGFESVLYYLSPDLSENRTVIRESIYIPRKSKIKIIFEEKDFFTDFNRDDFNSFIKDLSVQIWNGSDYFYFENKDVYLNMNELNEKFIEIPIGEIVGKGTYSIHINSNSGVNPHFNIGIGIGRESRLKFMKRNKRRFY